MIPFIGATTLSLGGISIQVWGLLVGLGYALGTLIAYKRAKTRGLDPERILSLATWMFVGAMLGARVFHVFLYDFAHYQQFPLQAFDPRLPGFSMMGGLFGALGVFFWMMRHAWAEWVAYADVLAWGVPWGCGVGRIGCFLIHDHPGTLSQSVLAVRYPDGVSRHDLGLYLSLVGFGIGLLFLLLNRRARPVGFFVALYFALEGLSRVWLDAYRIADARYWGWTPAQWLGLVMFLASSVWFMVIVRLARSRKTP